MAATIPMLLPRKSQEGIIQLHKQCSILPHNQWNLRERMRQIDLSYQRENDLTSEHQKAKIANRYGNADKIQNVTVPIVMPQVESAVAYQSAVFLTGSPLFGIVANPMFMDEAMQMETVIDENAVRGGWTRQLMMFFRDGFKYNFSALEVAWGSLVTPVFETDLGSAKGEAKVKEIIWSGNCLSRWDPYNTYFDSRVPPAEISTRGEFAGHTMLMSRTELKTFINQLPVKIIDNLKEAFESGYSGAPIASSGDSSAYYTPLVNPNILLDATMAASTNWLAWAELSGADSAHKINYKNMYEVSVEYVKIIPADFNLKVPSANTPQIWKFIIVNHSVIIYAERQTNAHGIIPVLFGQPLEDGLGYQTKSLATNVAATQDTASALQNSVIAARRRAIGDRGIYDPSRISEAQINSPNPSAKIPCRPAAYGKNMAEAYYQIPFRDDQSPLIMQEVQGLMRFSDIISGRNQAQQGQFVKGNKTQHEYADVMAHANGRDQMISMLYESQVFTPLKEILKINILQYQGGTTLYNKQAEKTIQIDPVALRKAVLEFKVSDGLTPSDKLIHAEAFQTSLQVLGSSPAVSSGYNVAPLFSYLMKTQGADLKAFEKSPEQIAYESAVQSWQQVVMEAMKQGIDPQKLPPQPLPQQFNYQPAGNNVASPQATQTNGA